MRLLVLVSLTAFACTAAFADPLLSKAEIATAARKINVCLTKAENADSAKCVGLIQNECDDNISAGGEAAHATCADNETAAWDVLLNETWSTMPQSVGPARFADLKKVQKTWITYRDAKCDFMKSADNFGWGLMLAAQCRLDETARRVRELRDLGGDPNFATP